MTSADEWDLELVALKALPMSQKLKRQLLVVRCTNCDSPMLEVLAMDQPSAPYRGVIRFRGIAAVPAPPMDGMSREEWLHAMATRGQTRKLDGWRVLPLFDGSESGSVIERHDPRVHVACPCRRSNGLFLKLDELLDKLSPTPGKPTEVKLSIHARDIETAGEDSDNL